MDKARVERQIKQLRAAKQIIELALEDLKNVEEFRDSEPGNILYREKTLAMLSAIIAAAEAAAKGLS